MKKHIAEIQKLLARQPEDIIGEALCHSRGAYPYFDRNGALIAFGRYYKVKGVDHFDLYTDEIIRKYVKNPEWTFTDTDKKNGFEKIPCVKGLCSQKEAYARSTIPYSVAIT